MWQNSAIATVTVLFAFAMWLFNSIDFLIPYKHLLLHRFGPALAVFFAMLAVNLFALFFLATRRMFLKDTGRKLQHIEKQLRDGSVASDLSAQLNSEK